MSDQHTQEPWRQSSLAIYDAKNRMVLQIGVSADRCFCTGEMEANARRIVACVNACEGMDVETLELRSGLVLGMFVAGIETTKQRDEQAARVKWMADRITYLEHRNKAGVLCVKAPLGQYWPQCEDEAPADPDMIGLPLIEYIDAQIALEASAEVMKGRS